jgi:acetolactate synthase-1/2/3 large subunit
VTVQSARLKRGQRLYSNSGSASMGYDLPATIGAWHAMPAGSRRIICLAGDGSIMQNLQELQTIAGQCIPAKIFLYNNNGYHSIRQPQQNHFNGFSVGCGPETGVTFPDFAKIATAFGFNFVRTSDHSDMREAVRQTLAADGPAICEVMIDMTQGFAPKLSSRRLEDGTMVSAPLEDLSPFLSREELEANMLIPLLS